MQKREQQDSIQYAPILHPSEEEFKNFKEYMAKIQNQYQHMYGIVKIVPPASWKPRSTPYDQALNNLIIRNPIEQNAQGKGGIYEFKHMAAKSMTYNEYTKQNKDREQILQGKSIKEVQSLFWKSVVYSPPIYGADLSASLMDNSAGNWHLDKLNTILENIFDSKLKGVNSSYCYIGSWKSLFCWHTEDLDLSAINYLHFGKSKFWYCIQPDDGKYLEQKAKKEFYASYSKCPQYLRHKTILISPYLLKKQYPDLKIHKVEQQPGEFVVAFNKAYHCGFNLGLNVAEAVNFATYKWINTIKKLQCCYCRKSSVKATYSSLIQALERSPEICSDPQYQAIKQQMSLSTKNLDNQSCSQQQSPISKTKRIKKYKKPKNKPKTIYVQCDMCDTWRLVQLKKNENMSKCQFFCSFVGEHCNNMGKERKKSKKTDEKEYLP